MSESHNYFKYILMIIFMNQSLLAQSENILSFEERTENVQKKVTLRSSSCDEGHPKKCPICYGVEFLIDPKLPKTDEQTVLYIEKKGKALCESMKDRCVTCEPIHFTKLAGEAK